MMDNNLIYLVLLLVLPISALAARRLPLGRVALMALAWIGIFAVGFVVYGFFQQNSWIGSSVASLFYGDSVVGRETRIAMAEDGHFYARATVNGVRRVMLIDSGATTIALTPETAKAAGLDADGDTVSISTANGTVDGRGTIVPEIKVGSITATGLKAVILDGLGDNDVIGMNFLSELKSWRVEGKTLILTPKPE